MAQLICPLCRTDLLRTALSGNNPGTPAGAVWRCPKGHSFDVAREGYVNLLPVQHKHSRAPGDNPDMIRARRAFLDAGHYLPLRDAVLALLRPLQATSVLDIGCGEGYYTRALATVTPDVTGLDIARDAVKLAAKRDPGITWLVATSAQLPLADHSVDLVCSLFSPLPAAEIARVLKPGGHLLVVTPGPNHLLAIREQLFAEVRPHRPEKFVIELQEALPLRQQTELHFNLLLDHTAREQLLLMTPYAWRATAEHRARLTGPDASAQFSTGAAFTLLLFAASAATPAPAAPQ